MAQAQVVPERTIQPSEVATTALKLLTATETGVARPGGIFTKEDLINIKLYAKKGLSLPQKQPEVEGYIGYQSSGIAGLEPPEITDLFQQIGKHCLGWDGVQQSVVDQGIELKGFSGRFVTTGEGLLGNIKEWPFGKRVLKTLGDVSGEKLEDITYGPEDKEIAQALGEILDLMRKDVDLQQAKTLAVKKGVSDYRIVLVGGKLSTGMETPGLEPQVARKRKTMVDNKLTETIKADEDSLNEKEGRITQLKKDYDKYVGLAFTGAAGGIIGLAITGGIFGAKAEAARKERNQLIDEVRALKEKVTSARKLQKAIETLSLDFSDIGTRMLDAETAMGHLEYMWSSILSLIENSQNEWKNIDNGMKMSTFITSFQSVVNPWKTVGDLSGDLMKIIDEGLAEYKQRYGS
ncbi:alpha-xenorhabdolysin family binary toxin subunit A [Variovorax sp. J22R133]|uniref:alpha-xenorhabdolysin family binary toxin subunit A n=1 Tax=Variovorax brevis TaxID=3053503 RepID=UPI002574CC1C|nr:alpha-xenorhabdolysin family binary toxin subunit A [Variovorax sp. J22R133]MDM0116128.1 alpha-xenorhabdolysin family binary toxin subunit A [Variovorax sp. J22R133]